MKALKGNHHLPNTYFEPWKNKKNKKLSIKKMYSENYPEKLDFVNFGPKITLKRLYYSQKLSKISKVNEI